VKRVSKDQLWSCHNRHEYDPAHREERAAARPPMRGGSRPGPGMCLSACIHTHLCVGLRACERAGSLSVRADVCILCGMPVGANVLAGL
jgi:hypothetical protein